MEEKLNVSDNKEGLNLMSKPNIEEVIVSKESQEIKKA
jgi:hypothetical protein